MLTKHDMYKYTGDISQIIYAKSYRLYGGRADGMRAVDINNGSGLLFMVLADRCMDIGQLSFRGVNFSFISKAGHVAPAYYDDKYAGWLKTFGGGFLTTCGLTQVGTPCECDDGHAGQHGSIGATPAEDFSSEVDLNNDIPKAIVKGKMRTGRMFGHNLWMTREIETEYGVNSIHIRDRVENRGEKPCPYMILYHFNIGYPLLDENTEFRTNSEFIQSRDEQAKKGESERMEFQTPSTGYSEQVFYYKNTGEGGESFAEAYNEKLNLGVRIRVDAKTLPNLVQWKNAGYGDYALGIEPSNCYPEGRIKQKEYGLQYIEPMEIRSQELYIEIIER